MKINKHHIWGVILLLIILFSCTKEPAGHTCRWELCPYKGATNFEDKSLEVNGTDDCEEYWLGIYHMQFPSEDYDQLQEHLHP